MGGVKAERVSRAAQQAAKQGRVHAGGTRPFGYADVHRSALKDDEAALVREACARILNGDSAFNVAADWNERGLRRINGGKWTKGKVEQTLSAASLAGLRSYKGDVVAEGDWPAILSRVEWEQLQATIASRRSQRKRPPKRNLLAGLIYCGACGSPMAGCQPGTTAQYVYRCSSALYGASGCGKSAAAHRVEEEVTARLLAFLSSTDAQAVSEDPFEAEAAVGALRAAEAGLEQMAQDHYVHRLIGRAEFMAARAGLEAQVEDAKRRITGTSRLPELALGPEVKVQWETAALPWRRSVVEGVIDRVTIMPAEKRGGWDPERVKISWLR